MMRYGFDREDRITDYPRQYLSSPPQARKRTHRFIWWHSYIQPVSIPYAY